VKMSYYFAYGSNLNKKQMKGRCRDAKAIGPLVLPQARLIFRGVADVEWHETESVQGGLWKISERDERELDIYEGVKNGLYRKVKIRIALKKHGVSRERDALVYVMNRSHYAMPYRNYYDTIAKGFADFKLDGEALKKALRTTSQEVSNARDYFASAAE
jgi:gamma-glutamylcyclotransferase (GGCT)/AIG2-like uncharacterized protein YtfP